MNTEYTESEVGEIAKKILQVLGSKQLIFLSGDLGSGKTTLTSALLKQLGNQRPVKSPTFGLVESYDTNSGIRVHHMDLYRIRKEEELLEAGILELINSGDLCIIEWPDLLQNHYSGQALKLQLSHCQRGRSIQIG